LYGAGASGKGGNVVTGTPVVVGATIVGAGVGVVGLVVVGGRVVVVGAAVVGRTVVVGAGVGVFCLVVVVVGGRVVVVGATVVVGINVTTCILKTYVFVPVINLKPASCEPDVIGLPIVEE
jgi:hypothetical protein